MNTTDTSRLIIPARLRSIPLARAHARTVAEQSGFDPSACSAIELGVEEAAARHVADPAAHQSIVRRGDPEQALAGDRGKVHHGRRAGPGEKGAHQVVHGSLRWLALVRHGRHSAT